MGWRGWKGRVLRGIFFFFYFSQLHPEKIKCRDRLLKLNVTCMIAFDTERQVCHMQAVSSCSPHIKRVFFMITRAPQKIAESEKREKNTCVTPWSPGSLQ